MVTFFDKMVDLESNNDMSFLDTPLCQLVHEDDDDDSLSPSLDTDININNGNENDGDQQTSLNEENVQRPLSNNVNYSSLLSSCTELC